MAHIAVAWGHHAFSSGGDVAMDARAFCATAALALAFGGISVVVIADDDKPPPAVTLRKLRSSEAEVLVNIERGYRRSPTFAALVDLVEGSDVFVQVELAQRLSGGMAGCLLHGGTGPRLRVLLKKGMPIDRWIQVLAHELQHVREVLEADIGSDGAAMEALFDRIGSRGLPGGRQYETSAAQRIERIVAGELRASRKRP